MKNRCSSVIGNCLVVSTGLLFALCVPGQAATWAAYTDDTKKCRLDYPRSVFTRGKKDAEDFQRFSAPDKDIYFRVTGLPNDELLSPKQIRMEYIKNRGKSEIVYERTKSDFLVLSGIRDQKIFYTKIAVSPNTKNICVLHIVYPQKEKRALDAIVSRMSRSFEATN
jgi:hypothetical protein